MSTVNWTAVGIVSGVLLALVGYGISGLITWGKTSSKLQYLTEMTTQIKKDVAGTLKAADLKLEVSQLELRLSEKYLTKLEADLMERRILSSMSRRIEDKKDQNG